jgi:signal transduction histidine kinase
MEFTGRRKSIAFVIAFGAGLISVILVLYIGWILLEWRTGLLLVLGILLVLMIICGIALNTVFLVREIRKNEQHDAFINAVTHELKTPVASIRLYLQTLQTRPVDEEKRAEFYRIMLADSDRLMSTIEQVLRTGRLGVGHKHHFTRVDVDEVVRSSVERVRSLHHMSGDGLRFEPAGASGEVMGDPEELSAAITNLVENAVKYSGSNVHVTVRTERTGENFTVRVTDLGPGIPKEELKRVFRRFYRIPGPIASRVKGTGLGLFIVRTVAKRHGGRAWAESEGPGRGSTFAIQLPAAK